MKILTLLDWPARVAIGAVVAVAIGGGAFLIVRTSGDEGDPTVQGATTATVAATVTTATSVAPTSTLRAPTATAAPATEPPPTEPPPTRPPVPTATEDTRVSMGLPTAAQIQLGKDGTYFVADRGDGCTWVEYLRDNHPEIGLQVFLRTDCAVDFGVEFRPETGDVIAIVS